MEGSTLVDEVNEWGEKEGPLKDSIQCSASSVLLFRYLSCRLAKNMANGSRPLVSK